MTVELAVCLLLGLAASGEDLWRRRISNFTVLAGLAAGLGLQIARHGWAGGPLSWAAGAATGFAVFLVFFLAGGMGGGDIKLMAAFGACLGPGQVLWAALLAAIVGALAACAYLLLRPQERSLPYAPAIFLGALLSFIGR